MSIGAPTVARRLSANRVRAEQDDVFANDRPESEGLGKRIYEIEY